MSTEEPTQLDRIEAKLDEVLTHLRPVEITQGEWIYSPPPRRWWQRKQTAGFDVEAAMEQLNGKGVS